MKFGNHREQRLLYLTVFSVESSYNCIANRSVVDSNQNFKLKTNGFPRVYFQFARFYATLNFQCDDFDSFS